MSYIDFTAIFITFKHRYRSIEIRWETTDSEIL